MCIRDRDGSSSYKIVKKAEDTKKDDANSNTTKKDDTTAVQAKNQTITATASYKKSETSKAFKLNAKTNGNGKLTYTTSNKAVATVDAAGKVTVKGPGVAKITVKAAATTDYKAASKTVTVTVAPKKQGISLVNKIKKQLTIKWKKNTKASGYQVVYSTNKKFTGKKTVRKDVYKRQAMYRTSKIPMENTGDYRTIPEGVLSQKVLFFLPIACVAL